MGEQAAPSGPDLAAGVPDADVRDGGPPVLGHVGDEAVVLVRDGGKLHALGATCTHYGGPLAEGIVAGGAIHCPWHHACFDLATGRAARPGDRAARLLGRRARGRHDPRRREARRPRRRTVPSPASVVIIGGGAAGVACAEALRAEGHRGDDHDRQRRGLAIRSIARTCRRTTSPAPRPRSGCTCARRTRSPGPASTLVAGAATAIDREARKSSTLAGGRELGWDALLIATGAEPIRLPIPGADLAARPHAAHARRQPRDRDGDDRGDRSS